MKRTYQQSCALAHALDVVGERWALLVVRELLVGPRRYGELLDNLAGIGTNLLAARLREMQHNGLIEQVDRRYRLTAAGRMLEPVVHALVRFGMRLEVAPDPTRLARPEWDCVALRALFSPEHAAGLSGTYALVLDGHSFSVTVADGEVDITLGVPEEPRARVSLGKGTAAALSSGEMSLGEALERGKVELGGRRREARRLLQAFDAR
ncbi:MAG: winged helix-turn-helix transcriptional regulator [Kofleriaceae bacterium]